MTDSAESGAALRRRCGGLLIRRERWSLSTRGWGLLLLLGLLIGTGLLRGVHPYLAIDDGSNGEVLVVEGWIGGRRLDSAARAYRRGHYRAVIVVRDVDRTGDKWESGQYTADYVAVDLVRQGVPADAVHVLLCPTVRRDRTYTCALAVREWLDHHPGCGEALDVATLGVHARRSRLVYCKVFEAGRRIGAIGLDDVSYDPVRWWQTSEGVREVLSEVIAYGYARLFFWPDRGPVGSGG